MSRTKLNLEKIIFIGRTYEEYLDMFSLKEESLIGKKILDCPSGACSFTAVGRSKGIDITAADMAYDHAGEVLEEKGRQDLQHAMEHMEEAKSNYIWSYFQNMEELKKYRQSALENCTQDWKEASDRYVPVVLPELPFKDEEFELVLSAHFLFMYADRLTYEFHLSSLQELVRVAKEEVRLFPVVDLEGRRYKRMEEVIDHLKAQGYTVKEVSVSYEFQKNANSMLVITKNKTGEN
ncbi:SAM-dependent methyltransferase [Halobacillus sp. B23F22_1]|uniref:SAM-dependent methyltransferase n=1 Tax=Halobacillus sp. B23F22_1 TaxID=3459514 RepID=UPI00373F9C9A